MPKFYPLLVIINLFIVLPSAVLALPLSLQQADCPSEIEREVLVLANGLKVSVVSNPVANKSSVVLRVDAGSREEKVNELGTAHLLEHVLLMGSTKYPTADGFTQFLAARGGNSNAHTYYDATTYEFTVNTDSLQEALTLFVDHVKAPLLAASLVEKERKAVDAEFNYRKDMLHWRLEDAVGAALKYRHPYFQFSIGNSLSFYDYSSAQLAELLRDFWRMHYSSDNMNFVIETPLPLGEIVPLVKAQLTSLERRETKKTKPSFAEITGSLPMQVKITMDDTERYLRLYFPLLSRGNYHQSAAAEYVEYLLEQHQPDTLANNLDSFKYGRDFSVNLEEHDDLQFIVVDYDLFYQGGENYWQVMRRLFSYVDLLKKGVAEKWRFDEFLKKQATKWCYSYRSEVDQLSYNLSKYPLDYVIGKGYGADEFQPEDYLGILNAINVNNMLQVVVHPDFSLSEKSKWLDVAYEVNRLSQSERDAFRPTENYYLALPKANPYIFDTVRLVGSDLNTLPKRIDSGVNVTSYIAQNTIYKSPDAFLYVKLSAPVIDQSARNSAGIDLWLSLMERQIGRDVSMALAADTKFDIERETNGIVFYIQGTTKAIDLLLEKVLSPIKIYKEKERDFEGYRYGWKDYLSKTESFHPLDLSFRLRHQFLAGPSFSMKERSRAMENVSYSRVISLLEDWRENMLATVMAHGNVTDADLVRWSRSIADATVEHKGVVSVEEVVTVLPKGVHRVIDETTNTDSVIRTLVQGWDDSPEEEARMRLLSMFLSERFFNELRTERQLGYVIRANRIQYSKTPGLEFVIQSPSAGPDQLDKQILQFFASYAEKLPKMKAEEFSNYQNALLKSLTDDPERLFGVVNRHWRGIVDNQGDFSRHDAISKAISQLTHEKFSQWFVSRFVSENRRVLSILIEGDKHKLSRSWKAENKETLVSSKESLLKSAEVREYVLSNSAVSVVTGENSQP